jgi:mannose-6-phosphate isomerase-like protein (cupin superfamily)
VSDRVRARRSSHSRCELIPLGEVVEPRGSLCVAEASRHISFEIRRVYWVFDVPPGGERAHHAHREQHELLIAVQGGFTVHCDDGEVKTVYRLDSPAVGLLIPKLVWHHLELFSVGAICLVLASGPYDPVEYVHDYEEFGRLMGRA